MTTTFKELADTCARLQEGGGETGLPTFAERMKFLLLSKDRRFRLSTRKWLVKIGRLDEVRRVSAKQARDAERKSQEASYVQANRELNAIEEGIAPVAMK